MDRNPQARSHTAGRAGSHRGPIHGPIKTMFAHRAALCDPLPGPPTLLDDTRAAHLRVALQRSAAAATQCGSWNGNQPFASVPGNRCPFTVSRRRTRIAANKCAGKRIAGTCTPPTPARAGGDSKLKAPGRCWGTGHG